MFNSTSENNEEIQHVSVLPDSSSSKCAVSEKASIVSPEKIKERKRKADALANTDSGSEDENQYEETRVSVQNGIDNGKTVETPNWNQDFSVKKESNENPASTFANLGLSDDFVMKKKILELCMVLVKNDLGSTYISAVLMTENARKTNLKRELHRKLGHKTIYNQQTGDRENEDPLWEEFNLQYGEIILTLKPNMRKHTWQYFLDDERLPKSLLTFIHESQGGNFMLLSQFGVMRHLEVNGEVTDKSRQAFANKMTQLFNGTVSLCFKCLQM